MHTYSERYYQQPPPSFGQQPQYYQQFPGYGYPQPASPPIAAPFPIYPATVPAAGTPAPGRPRPLDREHSRSSTPGRPGLRPLKSAMKRTRTPDRSSELSRDIPLTRGRSSDTIHRQRTRSGSRLRANSIPQFVPDSIILTLRSTNVLLLENLLDSSAAAELTEEILPIWQQGVNTHGHSRGKWRVEFAGSPWASAGLEAILAGRMIIRLYIALARLGYTYLSTVNAANPWKPPQLIFSVSEPAYDAYAFAIMISRSGDRITILDGPTELIQEMGTGLRKAFPRKIKTDRATEDGLHIFEVKLDEPRLVDKSLLIAYMLRFLNLAGFRLSGSVPMGSRSIFSLGKRKELWIFRYYGGWQASARQKEAQNRRPSSRQSRQSRGDHDV